MLIYIDYKTSRGYTKYFSIKFLILVQCDFSSRAAATRLDEYDKLFSPWCFVFSPFFSSFPFSYSVIFKVMWKVDRFDFVLRWVGLKSQSCILLSLGLCDILVFTSLLYKVPSNSTGKNFVTNIYWNYL